MTDTQKIDQLKRDWDTNPRWKGILRPYKAEDVLRLRGSVDIEYTLARRGAEKFWELLNTEPYIPALGALTGNQAVQQVQAGLKTIYVSGWQVAADANDAGQMYPDQSLYPSHSVPMLVHKINSALLRADQVHHVKGNNNIDWVVPVVADGEAGFGGSLNAFELMKAMIQSGAASVHFEDQLSSAKKCGHMGGKVLLPTQRAIKTLTAVRLAADVLGVPTVIIGRTDADGATLLSNDIDPRDRQFMTGERTLEGYYRIRPGLDSAIARGLAYAPYCDLVWCETSEPNLEEAKKFAEGIHRLFPDKPLAYNCSPSFNWKLKLDESTIASFQRELAVMGYKFQFVTLAGFHTLNYTMFQLAKHYEDVGMTAYAELQRREFKSEPEGYEAVRHQEFVGAGYFDEISKIVSGGDTSMLALLGSTEEEQFRRRLRHKAGHKTQAHASADSRAEAPEIPVASNPGD